jgi:drug/metabolite transporter (DMT)-like permease
LYKSVLLFYRAIYYYKTMTERHKALIAIILCVLFWGFSFISIKVAITVLPPMTLGATRFALALISLFIIKHRVAPKANLRRQDLPYLAGAGLIGVTLYFFCENNGVALVTASEASIIVAFIPVLTMTAERLFGKEKKVGIRRWTGAAVSVIGVWLVAGGSFAISGNALGYIYMIGAAVSWVAYCFLTEPLFSRNIRNSGKGNRLYIVYWQSVFGFLGFLPFALYEFPRWSVPNLPVLGHIAFLGICCSALGYWYYARSLEVLGVAVSSIFINFIPVVTAIAGFFIMEDRLAPLQWAGAAMVISGVTLTMTGNGKTKIRASRTA